MQKEEKRLEELNSYQILDTPVEKELDELAELASLICEVPISLITFVDEERQWFKANKGLNFSETKREDSFCQHTLNEPKELFIVEDSLQHPIFKNNALVIGNPNIRFYAGAPLETPDGNVLGTLCVIDQKPRKISTNQQKALKLLAKKAMEYLNTRKLILKQRNKIETNAERLKKLTDNVPGGIFQMRMTADGNFGFEFLSQGMKELHPSIDMEEWLQSPEIGFSVMHPDDTEDFREKMMESFKNLTVLHLKYRVKSDDEDDSYRWHLIHANPEQLADDSVVWYGSFHNINDRIEYEKAMEQIAYDISHVLRRPVTSLLGLNSLIDIEKDLTKAKFLEYAAHIKSVALEMESFTSDLNEVYNKKQEVIRNQHKTFHK